jgi:hypothetical protein
MKKRPNTAAPSSRPWTSSEIKTLRSRADQGAPMLAALLDRTPESVRSQAKRSRVSLRRRGENRGILMDQARGVSLAKTLRRDLLDANLVGEGDVEFRIRESRGELCPECGQRPQGGSQAAKRWGLCEVCSTKILIRRHVDVQDLQKSMRDLAAARQQRHRGKTALKDPPRRGHERAGYLLELLRTLPPPPPMRGRIVAGPCEAVRIAPDGSLQVLREGPRSTFEVRAPRQNGARSDQIGPDVPDADRSVRPGQTGSEQGSG